LSSIIQDIVFACRIWARSRTLSGIIVLTMAVGCGASVALFSVIDGAVRHPEPYRTDPEHVLFVSASFPERGETFSGLWSFPELDDFAGLHDQFAAVVASRHVNFTLTAALDGGNPERVSGTEVGANVFAAVSMFPSLGRPFTPDDEIAGRPRVVILGDRLWRNRFGASPRIVGTVVHLDGAAYAVIGVMPPRYRWLGGDLFTPLRRPERLQPRSDRSLRLFAILRNTIDAASAQAAVTGLTARLERQYDAEYPEYRHWTVTLTPVRDLVLGELRPALWVLSAALALLLILTCANVANLLLVRATARAKEFAIRRAIGCGSRRVVQQILTESMVIAVIGGLAGVLIAASTVDALAAAIPPQFIPESAVIGIDRSELLFALALSIALGGLFGLLPAVEANRVAAVDVLRSSGTTDRGGGRRGARLRHALVITEMALATIILLANMSAIRTFERLTTRDLGFHAAGIMSLRYALPADKYRGSGSIAAYHEAVLFRLRAVPHVSAAGLISRRPFGDQDFFNTHNIRIAAPLRGEESIAAPLTLVSGSVFQLLGIPLLAGRPFAATDSSDSQPVVVVNQAFARHAWGDGNPIGSRVTVAETDQTSTACVVVGLVRDIQQTTDQRPAGPEVYRPYSQRLGDARDMAVLLQTNAEPESVGNAARAAIAAIDPTQPVYWMYSLDEIVADAFGAKRLAVILLSVFGALALVLCTAGIYGVLGFAVAQRTAEIGVRLALGAGQPEIKWEVLAAGMRLGGLGVSVGFAVAMAIRGLASGLWFGIEAPGLGMTTFVLATVLFAAALASFVPARRAARIEPATALRTS
jgi:putative ABC transport system permease protein